MTSAYSGHVLSTTQLLLRWLRTFPIESLTKRPDRLANCALWHAGHIAGNRRAIGRLIGCDLDSPEGLVNFEPGASGEASEDWPNLDLILADLETTADRLSTCLDASEAKLDAPAERILGQGTGTARENLLFLCYHEAFHVGQVEQMRKLLASQD